MDEERWKREALEAGDWNAVDALRRERLRRGEPGFLDDAVSLAEVSKLLASAIEDRSFEHLSLLYGQLAGDEDRKALRQQVASRLGWPRVKMVSSPEDERVAFRGQAGVDIHRCEDGARIQTLPLGRYASDCDVELGAGGDHVLLSYYFSAQSGSDWSEYTVFHVASGASVLEGSLREEDSVRWHVDGKRLVIYGYGDAEADWRLISIPSP